MENVLSRPAGDVLTNVVFVASLMEILLLLTLDRQEKKVPLPLPSHTLPLFLSAGERLKVSIGFIVSIVQTDIQC